VGPESRPLPDAESETRVWLVDIGIGLPNTLAHPGPLMVDWARRAEERGFTSLATIDRIVYPTYDTMTSLAVAAGATSRIGLLSGVLLIPLYQPVWLAKAAASLDAISGGRLTLGLGVGGRPDDFAAMGRSMRTRGRDTDAALEIMRKVFAGEKLDDDAFPVAPAGHPKLMIGGNSDAAIRRTVEHGIGWIAGGGGPDAAAPMIEKVRAAWRAAGREGAPRFAALAYFGLGDDEAESRRSLRDYYGFLGDWVDAIVDSALRTPKSVEDAVAAFAAIGVDELVFGPTIPSLDEVDRLADIVL
jgi:alkanesulfonate monooxygenase SsuD/methylene tetrahydromethanopterin reductase-like flavin-dependent oxidoreductase (luciferase family)